MLEKYVDGSVGAMVRLMVRGGCLPVRENTRMSWKCDDEHCVCEEVESEEHVLLDCNLYIDVRRRWKEKLASVNVDVYDAIKGYKANNDCIERQTIWYLGKVRYGMIRYGMVWYGMVWYGMVWYGMVWYGMVWYVNDMLC